MWNLLIAPFALLISHLFVHPEIVTQMETGKRNWSVIFVTQIKMQKAPLALKANNYHINTVAIFILYVNCIFHLIFYSH